MNAILKIDNFSDYEIYPKDGKIWSLKRNKFLGANRNGYLTVALYADDGSVWNTGVHRVIYTACYGEISEGLEVNHIDEDKSNNSISNLNLMTSKENNNWGTRNERLAKALSKPVGAFKDGKLVLTFPSANEAERQLGFKQVHIGKCCKGVKGFKTHKGYEWRYIETEKVSI